MSSSCHMKQKTFIEVSCTNDRKKMEEKSGEKIFFTAATFEGF